MRAQVVAEAQRWLGTPYRHQASALGAGCDCLGLVRGVWRALYGSDPAPLPPYAADWRRNDVRDALEMAAQRYFAPARGPKVGQLVLFRLVRKFPARHCAIMVADDRFIHAQEQIGVAEGYLSEAWARRMAGCFEFPAITG
ncbi:NlpC/P60 family protein [Pelagibacterium xiamenense]|uniref:NlpC/P60 family protein n=1 Tax=Pelagibacterium xiamenense TaxID=2901140 RepID=UPI001E601378|nr:NlpC/P60 family protein [Pelagibacterium xiamenense]MCD7059500.1 NlpC/P60 family protein [Pelagibacterium xiamenense]